MSPNAMQRGLESEVYFSFTKKPAHNLVNWQVCSLETVLTTGGAAGGSAGL